MLKYTSAGESHGEQIIGILEGLPANLKIKEDFINKQLKRRQGGFGRGPRMKIEADRIHFLSGIADLKTTGNPIALSIENRGKDIDLPPIVNPRPGHGDLVGLLKYDQEDARNILERASARETAIKVGLGSLANLFLKEFGVEIYSHVIQVGKIKSPISYYNGLDLKDLDNLDENNIVDKDFEKKTLKEIESIKNKKDSIGGVVELIVRNLPVGLGSYRSYKERIDGLLSMGLMSIPSVKGVEIGIGFEGASLEGSNYHDQIYFKEGYERYTNHAGGIEAGMSNGEDVVIRMVSKPIPTLKKPLKTVNIRTKENSQALVERADTCIISSLGVIGESMVALVLAEEFLKKFGGDSMAEISYNYKGYKENISKR